MEDLQEHPPKGLLEANIYITKVLSLDKESLHGSFLQYANQKFYCEINTSYKP